MREFKFRAWIAPLKKYTNGIFIKSINGQKNLRFWAYDRSGDSHEGDDVIFEQFTGLKDEDGVDIYEGDILHKEEINMNSKEYAEWADSDFEDQELEKLLPFSYVIDVAVMSRFPRYWLRNEAFGYEGELLENPFDFKVIGNIHENPELLGDKK